MPYLDSISPMAQLLGAVNTVIPGPQGKLSGDNTDWVTHISYGQICFTEPSSLTNLYLPFPRFSDRHFERSAQRSKARA